MAGVLWVILPVERGCSPHQRISGTILTCVAPAPVVAILVRVLVSQGWVTLAGDSGTQIILAGVTDAGNIDPTMRAYVATGIQNGIMLGVGDRLFDPRGLLTRAQVAVLLQRLKTKFLAAGQ